MAYGFDVVRAFLISDEGLAAIGSHDLRKGAPVNRHVGRIRRGVFVAATVSDSERTDTYSLRRSASGGTVLCLARQDNDFRRGRWRRDPHLRKAEQNSVEFDVARKAKVIERQISVRALR